MTVTHSQFEHERFEELCALSTAGALTSLEQEELESHLTTCEECRVILTQYETLVTEGMTTLAQEYLPSAELAETPFHDTAALARLMAGVDSRTPKPLFGEIRGAQVSTLTPWRGAIAASILVGVAFASYRIGELQSSVIAMPETGHPLAQSTYIPRASDKQVVNVNGSFDRARLAELENEVTSSQTKVDALREKAKDAQAQIDSLNTALTASRAQSDAALAALTQDRDDALAKLRTAQALYQSVQYELDELRSQHKQDLIHVASMEDKVSALTATLEETTKHAKTDEQYLASDKDVRDLIGARNLYIADIMDVNESGQSRKPFGRVFYTKTKSLIFYAYDLDREQGIKQTSTFQVWGRTGPKDRKPINLGMLYLDSETNKRWTMRIDDPQELAQLDAIFVTAEPQSRNGVQPDKPSGKPFLYASLRREPNHP